MKPICERSERTSWKFDEIANEVWYAGAALVNEDGEVEKNLEVTYASVRVKEEIENLTKTGKYHLSEIKGGRFKEEKSLKSLH